MKTTWEENTERRVGILEQKVDKILDPETGIYPSLTKLNGQLMRWAIGILTALVMNLALVLVLIGRSG